MKSVCLLTYTNPNCGGTDKISVFLANSISDKYKVYILALYGKKQSFFEIDNDVKLKILFPIASKNKLLHFFTRKLSYKIKKLERFLVKNNIDVIIDVDIALTEISSPACKDLDIKHISWDHYSYKLLEKDGLRKKAFIQNSKNLNDVVVLTKEYYKYYINSNIYQKQLVHQIYNPISLDFKSCKYLYNTKKVLTIGRYHEQKAYDDMLKVWSVVEPKSPGWELHIYGRDQDNTYHKIEKLKQKLNLRRVYLHHDVQVTENLYQDSDIYVCSSKYEGHPLSLIDACAAGLPLVSFDCPCGPSEIIKDNYNGFLVEQGNVNLFADRLIDLIKDKNKRQSFGKNSIEISKKFDCKSFVNSWSALIDG